MSHRLITDSWAVFQLKISLSFYMGFVHFLGVNVFHLTIVVCLMLRNFVLEEVSFQSNCNTFENVLQKKFLHLALSVEVLFGPFLLDN